MLLEIENALYKRVHDAIGASAVVMKLAEEIDKSGKVAEQTMAVVAFTSASNSNPHTGAYIPTVRTRSLTYTITIIQKQSQRLGHSFALPILDVLADAITGWVPEIPGLQFQTGFELNSERFTQVTEASQYVYEQSYTIDLLLKDNRFFSTPCAGFDSIEFVKYLPSRKCLKTASDLYTGLAVWRRNSNEDQHTEEYVVTDLGHCSVRNGDVIETTCTQELNGQGSFRFIPFEAIGLGNNGETLVDESKVISGDLEKVWKCYKNNRGDYPAWVNISMDLGIWVSKYNKVGDKNYSVRLPSSLKLVENTYGKV